MVEPQAAVAIVHAPKSDQGPEESVLLILRTLREDDPWSGHWSFPGGRREPRDLDLVETALRELAEECGIVLKKESLESSLPSAPAGRRVGRVMTVAPFLFRAEAELPTILDPEEAAVAAWVPLSVLRDPSRHCLTPVPRLPPELMFPAIQLNGVPLWGFTYRMLAQWLGLHPPCPSREKAGFEAARLLLEFLLANGIELRYGWRQQHGEHDPNGAPIEVAGVKGEIPIQAVLARLALPGDRIPPLSSLEIQPGSLRVVGLDFEEYLIKAE
jgi:8-oxo-dGTP pyrophosphatase MutT (NUDIX family)